MNEMRKKIRSSPKSFPDAPARVEKVGKSYFFCCVPIRRRDEMGVIEQSL